MSIVLVEDWYASLDVSCRRQIDALQDRAYGSCLDESDADDPDLHDPALRARSFMAFVDDRLVSYAGVVTTAVQVNDSEYTASGLSCVGTDPDVARHGFASQVIAAATQYIELSGVDLGVFTCSRELVPLYTQAGHWEATPTATVMGSRQSGALTSTSLSVIVMMRLFSPRAVANAAQIRAGTIDLSLPIGQFW